jgi:hypothetical protein
VPWSEENLFGRGFFLVGSALPDQIADPSLADELDDMYVRSIPDELRRLWGTRAWATAHTPSR